MMRTTLNIEPIDLGNLYEPESVRFSFEAPGWYLLLALILAVVLFVFVRWLKRYQRNTYRREAIRNLNLIEGRFNNQNSNQYFNEVMTLLKLVAINSYGRQAVANLYGNEWIQFLESKGQQTPFMNYEDIILNVVYGTGSIGVDQLKEIIKISQKWIRSHA